MGCIFCGSPQCGGPAKLSALINGATGSLRQQLGNLAQLGGQYGIGGAPPPSHGSPDQASGNSPGAGANAQPGASAIARAYAAHFARRAAAFKGAGAGIMGVPVFAAGQMMQPNSFGVLQPVIPPPALLPLPAAGITVGEIVGWRIWKVRDQDKVLASYSADRIWLPGEPMDGKPADHGSQGVWAFKDRGRAEVKSHELARVAIGSVYLWGEVVEHAEGYRAEFAEIRSIDFAGPEGPRYEIALRAHFIAQQHSAPLPPLRLDEELLAALRRRYRVGSAEDADLAEAEPTNEKSAGPG